MLKYIWLCILLLKYFISNWLLIRTYSSRFSLAVIHVNFHFLSKFIYRISCNTSWNILSPLLLLNGVELIYCNRNNDVIISFRLHNVKLIHSLKSATGMTWHWPLISTSLIMSQRCVYISYRRLAFKLEQTPKHSECKETNIAQLFIY